MIKLYFADIRNLDENKIQMQKLPESYLRRAARAKKSEDRLRILTSGFLLWSVLGEAEIKKGLFGKPYISGGPEFNLSHSGDYVILATSDRPVGVDIEASRERQFEKLARKVFHPDEQQQLSDANDKSFVFYAIWTCKEAYIKAVGKGFSINPKSFCIDVTCSGAHIKDDGVYNLFRPNVTDGYSVAVCSEDYVLSDEIEHIL